MNQFSVSPEMAARYILNRQKELESLKESLVKKDFTFIASRAHNLKGTAESFGFPELGPIGEALEAAALNSNESGVQLQVKKIERWIESCLLK